MKSLVVLTLLFSSFAFARVENVVVQRDLELLYQSYVNLDRVMEYYHDKIKPIAERVENDDHYVLSTSESRTIDKFWEHFSDIRIALNTLYVTYEGRNNDDNDDARISLIRYASIVGLVGSAAILVRDFWDNERMRDILDGAAPLRIPRGIYISMQNEVFYQEEELRSREDVEFMMLFPHHSFDKEFAHFMTKINELMIYRGDLILKIEKLAGKKKNEYFEIRPFYRSTKNFLVMKYRNIAYKFSKIFYENFLKISTWIGDTKVKRINKDYYNGETLIKINDAMKLKEKLLPGDIMTSRSNWFLSNIFLPGFWPHAFIYLGTPAELASYFSDDIETNEFFREKCSNEGLQCESFTDFLATYSYTKNAWSDYLKRDKYNLENILIEATSEGVHFSTIRHTFLNDYLGVLRPNLNKVDIARTIYDAFLHFGKEYDFNMDWATDDRIVCSELVTKAYKSDESILKNGIDFMYDLAGEQYAEIILGRIAIPAVNIIRKAYDENIEHIRPSQMSFVAFLKGVRETDSAIFASEKDYYDSRNWPKWSFMQD